MPTIHPMSQGSEAWHLMRAGRLTASEFDRLVTPKWKARTGEGVEKYIFRKLAERYLGPLHDADATSWAMNQGSIMEAQALPWFEFEHEMKVQRVGLVTTDDDRLACSPDGLIGEDGGIEVKCPQPETHLRYLLAGVVPDDYLAQVHGSMLVTGRRWWKFVSYSRKFPALVVHVERDEAIIDAIGSALYAAVSEIDRRAALIDAMK